MQNINQQWLEAIQARQREQPARCCLVSKKREQPARCCLVSKKEKSKIKRLEPLESTQ